MQLLAYAVRRMGSLVRAVGVDVSGNGEEDFGKCGALALANCLFGSPYQMRTFKTRQVGIVLSFFVYVFLMISMSVSLEIDASRFTN